MGWIFLNYLQGHNNKIGVNSGIS